MNRVHQDCACPGTSYNPAASQGVIGPGGVQVRLSLICFPSLPAKKSKQGLKLVPQWMTAGRGIIHRCALPAQSVVSFACTGRLLSGRCPAIQMISVQGLLTVLMGRSEMPKATDGNLWGFQLWVRLHVSCLR